MPRLRKKWSLPPTNRAASATSEVGAPEPIRSGRISRRNISVPARLRLWPSSPICSIWAAIALTSTGRRASAPRVCSSGPSTSDIQRSRSIDLRRRRRRSAAPCRGPRSASSRRCRRAPGRAARTSTSTGSPRRPSARPCGGGGRGPATPRRRGRAPPRPPPAWPASPSSSSAPMRAPRSGPAARSQPIGGPACRNSPRPRPSASDAGPDVDQLGARPRASGRPPSALPGPCRGSASTRARSASMPASPSGGRQSTWVTAHRLRGQRVGEQLGADGDDARCAVEQASSRRLRSTSATACRAAAALDRKTRRRPRAAPRPAGAGPAGRPRWRTATRRPRAPGRRRGAAATAAREGRGELGGRVRVGAVPEHHVEQQHAAASGPRPRRRSGRAGCAGRSSGAPGPG